MSAAQNPHQYSPHLRYLIRISNLKEIQTKWNQRKSKGNLNVNLQRLLLGKAN